LLFFAAMERLTDRARCLGNAVFLPQEADVRALSLGPGLWISVQRAGFSVREAGFSI
jgi:hypothetical protein